ncbi:hypothetical protein EDD16DRAFT_1727282 [Pisolithus croceorrhizus]|nr:hypothetical protein EV401DRAFT_2135770 [Pisolithus croceorrhizus]KAI6116521.1 hypothetical protein EDD16DRAFT_1727282 [Pisolithus croceorrhizus]KAI6166380.1 hypothetical protein EDD17DRAFT_1505291 [Pisolithus thermaeus]
MPPPDVDADKTTYTENADHEATFMTTANAKKKAKPREEGMIDDIESIMEALMDSKGRGVKHVYSLFEIIELIAPPDLNQARVNRCFIVLVNRKLVWKDNTRHVFAAFLSIGSTSRPIIGHRTVSLAWPSVNPGDDVGVRRAY